MKTIIQLSETEEVKALRLLLRHSPGTVLPNRIYKEQLQQEEILIVERDVETL
jgi:hypothetical protein